MKLISTFINCNEHFDVFIMDNTRKLERKEFFECFYSSFGPRYNFDENWFDWYYLNNPFGICDNYLLINEKKILVGAFGYAKIVVQSSNKIKEGTLGINGFINPNFAGRGLYTDLMSSSLNNVKSRYEVGCSFPHGNNIGSIKGHIKSGWEHTKNATFFKRKINGVENKAKTSNSSQSNILNLVDFEFSKKKSAFFYKTFDWIKWRFFDRPDKKYEAITINNGTDLISGYLIYTIYSDSTGKRCQVADYDYHTILDFQKVLNVLINLAGVNNYSSVEFLVNEDHEDSPILSENGFKPSQEHYQMFTYGNIEFPLNSKIEYGSFDVI